MDCVAVFNRDKSRPSPEESKRINKYFEQYDTADFKIHDRYERIDKIKKIQKIINKLNPQDYRSDDIGGGIEGFDIIHKINNEYETLVMSVNSKDPHGIELLTLNQLEYVEKAIKEWKKK